MFHNRTYLKELKDSIEWEVVRQIQVVVFRQIQVVVFRQAQVVVHNLLARHHQVAKLKQLVNRAVVIQMEVELDKEHHLQIVE